MTAEEYISRLIEITDKKYANLLNMLELTEKQTSIITEDNLEALQKIVDEKQKNIDRINKLDEQFEVYFIRLKSEMKINSLNEIKSPGLNRSKELKDKISKVMSTIKEISEIENKNNKSAKDLLKKLGEGIKNINQGKKINSAYKPAPMQMPSYYMDKKK